MQFWPPRFFEKKSTLAAPEAWLIELFGAGSTASGISATPANAITCAVRRAAIPSPSYLVREKAEKA
jgi:hypothetical protein